MTGRSSPLSESGYEHHESWAAALQHALDSVLPEPVVPNRSRPQARIIAVNPAGTSFEIELRFKAGRTYCCIEPGCFLSTYSRAWWDSFRAALREVSDREPPPLSITIHGVVEAGAILDARIPATVESETHTYRDGPFREHDSRA